MDGRNRSILHDRMDLERKPDTPRIAPFACLARSRFTMTHLNGVGDEVFVME
jgi:hypothetical protein